jgi:hypothetical protein
MPNTPTHRGPSRVLHAIDELSTRPIAALTLSAGVLAMFVAIAVSGFSSSLQASFSTVCAGDHAQHGVRVATHAAPRSEGGPTQARRAALGYATSQ